MATVITNLLSAIPFFGQDLVELIWGGLNQDEPQYGDVLLKILLNAGNSPIFGFAYDLLNIKIIIIGVKIAITRGKSAGVRSIHTSEASQRLHAGDLTYAYLVGLFEGKGYFYCDKKGKNLIYELGFDLDIKDVQLIYKIKEILGVGSVSFIQQNKLEKVLLKIRDKNHLKDIIFPIFDKYPMFSNKQKEFLNFKEALLSEGISAAILHKEKIFFNSINSIIKSSYFSAWLVGYIEANGYFTSPQKNQDNKSLGTSLDIYQIEGDNLLKAIREYLSIPNKISLDKNKNSSKLKVTGVRSVENIINYLHTAPVKFLGKKKLDYLLWIKQLRKISRYSAKIKIPFNY